MIILQELETLINETLIKATNNAYANNFKYKYNIEFFKGTGSITLDDKSIEKNYYVLNIFIIDKTTNILGERYNIYTNYYPLKGIMTVNKLKLLAYKELITNSLFSLYNVTLLNYMDLKNSIEKEKDVVKKLEIKKNITLGKTPLIIK